MASSSDVFIIAASCAADPAEALGQTIKESGVNPARVQDFIFGADSPMLLTVDELAREVRINCPLVMVSSSMRALFFAAQSILCEDSELILVGGSQSGQSAALLLASPAAVGVYNLMPLARIDARSLIGIDHVFKEAGYTAEDVKIRLEGTCGVLLAAQLVEQLQESQSTWGLIHVGPAVGLIERI